MPLDRLQPASPNRDQHAGDSWKDKVVREMYLVGAVADEVKDCAVRAVTTEKTNTALKVALAGGLNFGLCALTTRAELGATAGRAILSGLGLAAVMDLDSRARDLSSAISDTWKTGDNTQRNQLNARAAVGQFVFDSVLMTGGGMVGGKLGNLHFNTYKAIPEFTYEGFLPPGVHRTNWDAFAARYGTNPHRTALLGGIEGAFTELRLAGYKKAYVGGSFVTAKELPKDFDATFRTSQRAAKVVEEAHPLLFQRLDQTKLYGGELVPHYRDSEPGLWSRFLGDKRHPQDGGILSFFSYNGRVNKAVGLIEVDLRTMPIRVPRTYVPPAAHSLSLGSGLRRAGA